MKPCILAIFTLFLSSFFANAGEMIISGVYNGKNLYLQNPSDGKGYFCITELILNDKSLPVPQKSMFELSLLHLELNTPIVLKLYHHGDCTPRIFNPEAIRTTNEFSFGYVDVASEKINWVGKGEKNFGSYFVESFGNGFWRSRKSVHAQGHPDQSVYEEVVHHHSGKNRYRIRYNDGQGKMFYSEEVEFIAAADSITFYPTETVTNEVHFSRVVRYEVLDRNHNIVLKGKSDLVDCSKLMSGYYILHYENHTARFNKPVLEKKKKE